METSSKPNFQKFSNIDAILISDYNVSWEASSQTPAEQKLRTNKFDFLKNLNLIAVSGVLFERGLHS